MAPKPVTLLITVDDSAEGVDGLLAWVDALSVLGDSAGLVIVGTAPEARDFRSTEILMRACDEGGIKVAFATVGEDLAAILTRLDVADEDMVMFASAHDVPTPSLVQNLRLSMSSQPGEAVEARQIPQPTGSPCLMTSRSVVDSVDRFLGDRVTSIDRLPRDIRAAGLTVVTADAGTVFSERRVDSHDGVDPDPPQANVPPRRGARLAQCDDPHLTPLPATSLGTLLQSLGVTARPIVDDEPMGPDRPFLTVITRTQGRSYCLQEMFTCLAAQSTRDFEVILARHRLDLERRAGTDAIVNGLPLWLRERVVVIDVDRPGRAAPLNDALDSAKGHYFAVLDDDDLVMSHWVETFKDLDVRGRGRVLRTVAHRQDVMGKCVRGERIPVPVGPPRAEWPETLNLVDHLVANSTPCMTVAFPEQVYRNLGARFDESMLATEDWEYLVSAVAVVGVECLPTVTSVYRWWVDDGSSRSAQTPTEWEAGHAKARRSFDQQLIVLPIGGASRIRVLLDEAWGAARHAVKEHDNLVVEYERTSAEHRSLVVEYERTSAEYRRLVELYRAAEQRAQEAENRFADIAARLKKLRRRTEAQSERITELEESTNAGGQSNEGRRGLKGRARFRAPGRATDKRQP